MKELKDFEGQKIAINCTTPEQAEAFCKLMHENGLNWQSGNSYLRVNNWDEYEEKTCYNFNEGSYARVEFYKNEGYTILPATDFLEDEFIYGQEYEFSDCEDFKIKRIQRFACLVPDDCGSVHKYCSFSERGIAFTWKYARKINTERTEAITTIKELVSKFSINQNEVF